MDNHEHIAPLMVQKAPILGAPYSTRPISSLISSKSSLDECKSRGRYQRQTKPFVRGPIPLDWLTCVAGLSAKSLHVGIVLYYLAGLTNSTTVLVSYKVMNAFHVTRWTVRRNLLLMEGAGLIRVERHCGRSPRVTIMECGEHVGKGDVPENL